MLRTHSFRFLDDGLNRALIGLIREAGIAHSVDEDGVVHYSGGDEDVIGNDLICSIRDRVFPAWQLLTCPPDWIASYRDYMNRRQVAYVEELNDGELWFLIPRKHRPHSWKLECPAEAGRPAEVAG